MWWIVYFHRGKRYRESTGLRGKRNEAAARRILRAKTGEVVQGTFQPEAKITVNQITEEFEKDYRLRGGRQFVKLHSHLKPVVAALGHLKAQDLTERRIDTYIEKRLQHVSAATINREMQPLGQALRLAHSRQLIKRVPNIRLLKEQNVREGFFEYDELAEMITHLPEYLRDFVWFGYYSGWRKGEIAGLEWRDVDMQARVIRLRPEMSKTSEGRVLALEGPLWDLLKRRWAGRDFRYVFHRDGLPIGDFRKAWGTACRKAGIKRIFHDLRRTAVRDMIRAGVPERVAMSVSGHKTREIFDRYNIVNESDLRDALRKTHLFRTNATKTPQSGISEWH
jgi:integrase